MQCVCTQNAYFMEKVSGDDNIIPKQITNFFNQIIPVAYGSEICSGPVRQTVNKAARKYVATGREVRRHAG